MEPGHELAGTLRVTERSRHFHELRNRQAYMAMVRRQLFVADRERPFETVLRRFELILISVQTREVHEGRGQVRMIRAERFLSDRNHAPSASRALGACSGLL